MSFLNIQSGKLADAMAKSREQALIKRVGEVLGQPIDREGVAQLGKEGRITLSNDRADMPVTVLLDGKPILFIDVPKITFATSGCSATQEIRRLS